MRRFEVTAPRPYRSVVAAATPVPAAPRVQVSPIQPELPLRPGPASPPNSTGAALAPLACKSAQFKRSCPCALGGQVRPIQTELPLRPGRASPPNSTGAALAPWAVQVSPIQPELPLRPGPASPPHSNRAAPS